MKRLRTRYVNMCYGCEMYRYCSARMNGKPHSDVYGCHSDYKTLREFRELYERFIIIVMKKKKIRFEPASLKVKRWMKKQLSIPLKVDFNYMSVDIEEAELLIILLKRYVK